MLMSYHIHKKTKTKTKTKKKKEKSNCREDKQFLKLITLFSFEGKRFL